MNQNNIDRIKQLIRDKDYIGLGNIVSNLEIGELNYANGVLKRILRSHDKYSDTANERGTQTALFMVLVLVLSAILTLLAIKNLPGVLIYLGVIPFTAGIYGAIKLGMVVNMDIKAMKEHDTLSANISDTIDKIESRIKKLQNQLDNVQTSQKQNSNSYNPQKSQLSDEEIFRKYYSGGFDDTHSGGRGTRN